MCCAASPSCSATRGSSASAVWAWVIRKRDVARRCCWAADRICTTATMAAVIASTSSTVSTAVLRPRRSRSRRRLTSRNCKPRGLTSTRSVTSVGPTRAPVSASAAASRPRSHSREAGRPASSHSAAACSMPRRARRPVEFARTASASGGHAVRNASCATPTTAPSSSLSTTRRRRSMNGSRASTTAEGSSARGTRRRVGRPCSSAVTRRSRSSSTCRSVRPPRDGLREGRGRLLGHRAAARRRAPRSGSCCSRPPRSRPSASSASV